MSWSLAANQGAPPAGLPGIVHIGEEDIVEPSYRIDAAQRLNDHVVVQATLDGCGACWPGGSDGWRPVPPGSCVAYIGREHAVSYGLPPVPRARWSFAFVVMSGDAVAAALREIVARHGHVLAGDAGAPAWAPLRRLLPRQGVRAIELPVRLAAGFAFDVIAELACAQQAGGSGDQRLDRALAWMRERLELPIGVAEAAQAVGLSRSQLSRLFVEHLRRPPAAWLREQRLAHARVMLDDPRMGIDRIARRCGFAAASQFIAAFRREHGMTPGRWRRRGDGG